MSGRTGSILFLLLAAAFLAADRGAYSGYFQDDEFNTLSWTRSTPVSEYVEAALTPRFLTNNFRPVGHFYFRAAERLFGLDFRGYVAVVQVLHLLNVWLLWLLARRLGAGPGPRRRRACYSDSTWPSSTPSGSPCSSSTFCAPPSAC